MSKRKQMVVYWDTEKDAKLIEELEQLAEEERRSRSATVLVAVKEYLERHGRDGRKQTGKYRKSNKL